MNTGCEPNCMPKELTNEQLTNRIRKIEDELRELNRIIADHTHDHLGFAVKRIDR